MQHDQTGGPPSRSESISPAALLPLAPDESRAPIAGLSPAERAALIACFNGGSLHKRDGTWRASSASTHDKPVSGVTVGTVKWFSVAKGIGFVEVDGGGKDVFVHISTVERAQLGNLTEGQRVSMRVVEKEKGRQAVAVRSSE